MKLTFLNYKTKRLLQKEKTQHPSVSYEKSKTMGVIFTVEDKQKHFAVKDFIKRLETDGKQVQVLEFLPEKTENYEFKFDFFSNKDVTFFGTMTSQHAIQFADAPFDYLFYLDYEPNPMILHLLARSHAKCRVGKYWEEGESFLDFMIESAASTKNLLDAIQNYVIQIR